MGVQLGLLTGGMESVVTLTGLNCAEVWFSGESAVGVETLIGRESTVGVLVGAGLSR